MQREPSMWFVFILLGACAFGQNYDRDLPGAEIHAIRDEINPARFRRLTPEEQYRADHDEAKRMSKMLASRAAQLQSSLETAKRNPTGGGNQPVSLQQACSRDVLTLCGARSAYDPAAVACLSNASLPISSTCRLWHSDRVRCVQYLHNAQACDSCARLCQHIASMLHCAVKMGVNHMEAIMPYDCKSTPYFQSIMRMASLHRRRNHHKARDEPDPMDPVHGEQKHQEQLRDAINFGM